VLRGQALRWRVSARNEAYTTFINKMLCESDCKLEYGKPPRVGWDGEETADDQEARRLCEKNYNSYCSMSEEK